MRQAELVLGIRWRQFDGFLQQRQGFVRPIQPGDEYRAHRPGGCEVGLHPVGFFQAWQGIGRALQRQQRHRLAGPAFRPCRIDGQALLEAGEGLFIASQAGQRDRAVGQDLDMPGLDLQCLVVLFECLGELAQVVQCRAEVHRRDEVVRPDRQRLAVAVGRILEPALQVAHPRREQPALVVLPVEPGKGLQVACGRLGIAALQRDQRQVEPRIGIAIVDRHRLARVRFGLVQPAQAQAYGRPVGQRRRAVGQELKRAGEPRICAFEVVAAEAGKTLEEQLPGLFETVHGWVAA